MKIDNVLLIKISSLFIIFTVVGTLSHELGHYSVAKLLGYETTIHYGSISVKELDETFDQKSDDFQLIKNDLLLIKLGGPIQTMTVGTFGLIFLLHRHKTLKRNELKITEWLGVFLALFWLREAFNLFTSVFMEIIQPNGTFFGGDERDISKFLNLWEGTLPILLGVFGTFVLAFISFKIIPERQLTTFLTGGIMGGTLGFLLWMRILGPKLLP